MLQKHERQQTHDLRFRRVQPQQQAREANGLFAQWRSRRGLTAVCRVAFVEDEINHRSHRREPLGAFHRPRRLERHATIADAALGAGDALLHRRFADQERARDLLHGKT
jgi:hypothetical protein